MYTDNSNTSSSHLSWPEDTAFFQLLIGITYHRCIPFANQKTWRSMRIKVTKYSPILFALYFYRSASTILLVFYIFLLSFDVEIYSSFCMCAEFNWFTSYWFQAIATTSTFLWLHVCVYVYAIVCFTNRSDQSWIRSNSEYKKYIDF